jgi:DNA-binding CsgD family transcriptional regulator
VRPFVLAPPGIGRAALAILPVPLAVPGGEACLVHVGIPLDGTRRIERYWKGVVAGAGAPASARQLPAERLSPREAQVLERLASGLDQKSIARELHVSYATVRNHAQRILRKLRVHSLQAAIGMHLLHGSGSSSETSAAAGEAHVRDARERPEPHGGQGEEQGDPPKRSARRTAHRRPAR